MVDVFSKEFLDELDAARELVKTDPSAGLSIAEWEEEFMDFSKLGPEPDTMANKPEQHGGA